MFRHVFGPALIAGSFFVAQPAQAVSIVIDVAANAANAAALAPTVDQFRSDLGALNANAPVNGAPNGRREIGWDDAPDSAADPNPLPGDFFNANVAPRAGGIEFRGTGATTGFLVSSTAASGQPTNFGFPFDFLPFSPERVFSPVGGNTFDVLFFDPADQTTPTATRGLGVVFADVELANATTMSFFDKDDNLLAMRSAPFGSSGSLSFLGLIFDEAVISKVSFTVGNVVLLGNSLLGPGNDGVVMDDFIFGEPVRAASQSTAVPLPASVLLLGTALAGLGFAGRRCARA